MKLQILLLLFLTVTITSQGPGNTLTGVWKIKVSVTYTNKANNALERGYVNKSDEYIREIKDNGTIIEHKAGKELNWGIYELRNAYLILKSPNGEIKDSMSVISKTFSKLVFEQANVPVENLPGTSPDNPDWVTAIVRYEFDRIKN